MKRKELEAAIYSLIDLLNEPSTKEEDFQQLFEDHPHCLHSLDYSDSIPHPTLIDQATGEKYIPDFLCRRRSDGIAEIVDLKKPSMNTGIVDKDGRRAKLNSEFEHCVSQVEDYIEFFQSNENKHWYENHFDFDAPRTPTGRIIGGGFNLDKIEVEDLFSRRNYEVHLSTYVDVLNAMVEMHATCFGRNDAVYAKSYYLPIRVHESNREKDGRLCLLDGGHKFRRNRLAVWIDSELKPGVSIYDDDRNSRELQASEALSTDRLQMVSVDFATSPNFHSLTLSIDGRTVQWSMGGKGLEIDKRLFERRLYLGADLKRRNGAAFDIISLIGFDRVLTVETQLEIYQIYWRWLGSENHGGMRLSHEAMFQQENGSLIAPGDEYRATFLGTGDTTQVSDFFIKPDISAE